MIEHEGKSPLVDRPTPDGREYVSEQLAYGDRVLHPGVAAAAEALAASTRALARSLGEHRSLRTPEATRRTLEGLHDLVLGAAAAVEAVGEAVHASRANGELTGTWRHEDTATLTAAAAGLRTVLPALADSAASVDALRYTGPAFATETERTRGLLDELRRQGARVTYDPTRAVDYHETDAGGGWRSQFTVPGDERTFEIVTGDIALDLSPLPLELAARDVHPAVVVEHVLADLDSFVAGAVVQPAAGDSGWIPPLSRRPAFVR
jgi:hypothetical protein